MEYDSLPGPLQVSYCSCMPATAQNFVPEHCRSYLIPYSAVQVGVQGSCKEKYPDFNFWSIGKTYFLTFPHKSGVLLSAEQAMGLPAEIFQVLSVHQTTQFLQAAKIVLTKPNQAALLGY